MIQGLKINKILSGHVSPETAYLVEDYPYGFRLRCKIRYWLESSANKGVRFCSQTTNPKRGDTWNKPKASTYSRFGGAMYLNEENHVTWCGVTEYSNLQEMVDFKEKFFDAIPESFRPVFSDWLAKKLAFNKLKEAGKLYFTVNGVRDNEPMQPEVLRA